MAMEMDNTLIYGHNCLGVRSSVSIDSYLWSLTIESHKDEHDARTWIRSLMASSEPHRSLSRHVQRCCLARIARPSLLRGVRGQDRQMDIEEI